MNPFLLWMRRRAFVALLLILLLSVGTAFGSVGVSAYLAANRQTETAAKIYTTVAIPYDPVWLGRTPVESFTYQQNPPDRYYDLDKILADVPVAVQAYPAVPLQGIIPDSIPVRSSDYSNAYRGYGMSQNQYYCCVVAVRCDSVNDISEMREYYNASGAIEARQKIKKYKYSFTLLEPLSVPAIGENERPIQEKLETEDNICQQDGSPIFEKGKTYLLWGLLNIPIDDSVSFYMSEEDNYPTEFFRLCESEEVWENGVLSMSQKVIWSVKKGDIPYYAEYTGSVKDFLASEEGALWQEMIRNAERNQHSVKILATDAVESLAPFCTRQNDLLEGRYYTAEEARAGARVCVVPALWAEKNGVHIGDMLSISLYAPQYYVMQFVGHSPGIEFVAPETDQAQLFIYPSYPEDYTGQTDDYEVVGIYTCPPPEQSSLRFDPDTVLIPKGAVEDADQYRTEDMTHYPLLNAYLIPNGAQEQLEDWLTEQGLGGNFLYFDYGYSVAEDAIEQMSDNGSRVLIGGIAAFLASLLLFCLLLRLLTSQTARFMRLLGQSPKAIRKRFAKTIPFWTVPSVLLGAILCRIGYGWVTGKLLSSALTFDYRIAGLVALAEAMAICVALLLTSAATAKTKPMRGGRK